MRLDTCALLRLVHDQSRISTETLGRIDTEPVVCISPITSFEIGMKYRAGKLSLPMPPDRWIHEILSRHHIAMIDLNLDICVKAAELPPIHKDPCDRFIIAAALIKDLPVVTVDRRFAEYGIDVMI